ncbi:hypothetical protein D3C80_2099950 [compost metagenome]
MPKFQVVRGYTEIEGVLHRKGSFFDAEPDSVRTELRKGIIVTVATEQSASAGKKKADRDEL